jgi:signal peptidase I
MREWLDMTGNGTRNAIPRAESKANEADGRAEEKHAQSPRETSLLRELKALLLKIAVIAGALFLLFTFGYGLHRNADPDMIPAIKDGDLLLCYRLDKDYDAGDVLLLSFKGETEARRVVAAEGDTVDITENGLIVNGAIQQEPGVRGETRRYAEGASLPVTLGAGEVFVLGDNRENATDSRVYGVVKTKDTLGSVIAVFRRRDI